MELFRQYPTTRGRSVLSQLLRERGLMGFGAEIGVHRGDFSEPFLEQWGGERLYLIDPWQPVAGYVDERADQFDPDDFEHVKRRFERFGDRAVILQATSEEAFDRLEGADLDFAYIDADHSYDHARQDLNMWWQRVRPGGILAGHDLFAPELCGVTNAVAEFCLAHGLICHVIADNYDSWFLEKP